jgi:hypothetical protein
MDDANAAAPEEPTAHLLEIAPEEAGSCLPCCTAESEQVTRAACCRCPPNIRPALGHLRSKFRAERSTIFTFVDGTVVYLLSKQWTDLLSIYIFRLHKIPFCQAPDDCGTEAPTWQLLLFALGMLGAAGLVRWYVSRFEERIPSLSIVPSMCGMAVGWSIGSVLTSAVGSVGSCESLTTCNLINLTIALLGTVMCAIVIRMGRPTCDCRGSESAATADAWRARATSCERRVDRCGALLVSFGSSIGHQVFQTFLFGIKYGLMILWCFVASSAITWGVDPQTQDTPFYGRLLVLWAISLTATLSALAVFLARSRRWLENLPLAADDQRALEAALEGNMGSPDVEVARDTTADETVEEEASPSQPLERPADAPRVSAHERAPGCYSAFTSVPQSQSSLRGRASAVLHESWAALSHQLVSAESRLRRRAALGQIFVLLETMCARYAASPPSSRPLPAALVFPQAPHLLLPLLLPAPPSAPQTPPGSVG